MKDLIIEAPRTGIAPSAHTGIADIRNLDIFTVPGIVRLNNPLSKKSVAVVTETPQWIVKNPITQAEVYALGHLGTVYKSTNSGTTWVVLTGNTFTVTSASPAVFTAVAHGLVETNTIILSTTGALYTGLVAGTTYYVIAAGLTADTFELSLSSGGAAVNTSGSESGVHSFKILQLAYGNGLAIWKDYLFVARNTKLDVYGPLTTSPVWTNNWKTIDSDDLWHPMFISKNDNKLYGGAGRYVFSLDEVSGQTFVPATGGTFTWTAQALDLPPNYKIKCLEELGNNLMCGTWQGTAVWHYRIADIFPWDRSSSSFGQPISISENGVHAMLNTGNSLIVIAGISGTIYKCNGVNIYPIAQIPNSVSDLTGSKFFSPMPGALVNFKGRIFFGMSSISAGGVIDGCGIWSLYETSKGNILTLEHGISTGNFGASYGLIVGSLLVLERDIIVVGWYDATPTASYGLDLLVTSSFSTSYTGYFISPFYAVGTNKQPRKFTEIEFQFTRPLRTNEGIKVDYRVDLTASFTNLGTWTYTTYGAKISLNPLFYKGTTDLNIPACENIQLKIYLTGSATSPELKNVILR